MTEAQNTGQNMGQNTGGARHASRTDGASGAAGAITCAQARLLLAASRRDEWAPAELTALSEHLSTCAACRQKQEAYRGVGEHIRELPTITPPASFRGAVFAAIEADRVKRESPAARLARADTDPELPVVRVRPLTRPAARQGTATARRLTTTRIITGLAAAIVLAFLGAQAFADFNPGALTNALSHILPGAVQPTVTSYTLGGQYPVVDSASAGKQWVVAVASAHEGDSQEMLVALDRATGKTTPLLSAPMNGPLHLEALTDSWVLWSQGDNSSGWGWTLYASTLPTRDGAAVDAPLRLIANPPASAMVPAGMPWVFTGATAQGNTVLVSGTSQLGMGAILRFDLSSANTSSGVTPQPQTVGTANSGDVLSDPVLAGATAYWEDTSVDSAGHVHSAILSASLNSSRLSSSTTVVPDDAFDPHLAGNTLVYVAAANVQAPAAGGLPALAQALANVQGTLDARDLTTGKTTQITRNVSVSSLLVGGSVVLYHAADGWHSYDTHSGAPLAVDSSLRHAAFVAVTAEAVAWGGANASSIQVYNLA